jgi:hypothetical protein
MPLNPANDPPYGPKSRDIGEIIHIASSQKRNWTLCGTKVKNLVKGEADCIVCLDILEYMLDKELRRNDDD